MEEEGNSLLKRKRGDMKKVSFLKLFSFADRVDVVLMTVGTLGAVAFGMVLPFMTIIFGQLVNTLAVSDNSTVVSEMSKVCIRYLYLAITAGIASFLQVSCWIITGERQAMRIRGLYLEAILRQDIEFFDTETTTGEVIGRMSGDTITIQEALGEKVGKFIQLTTTFIGGLVIAFIRGWRLAIVISSCVPVVIVAAGCMSFVISKVMVRVQAAYAEAGDIVEQTIGAIRTVASFNGEKQAILKYDEKLQIAYSATSRQGLASGLGSGTTLLVIWCSFALSIWYGSKLILQHEDYNGGKVINVMLAMMGGAFAMGQTSPCLSAFAEGTAAASKMFETMERKPKIDAYDRDGIILEDIKGEIELKDVHFRYPARPAVQIFSGFSLHIPSGKTAALVGQSGNGKSTVISLLERFYDPEAGEVLIDGVNLKNFRLNWIRSKMALVSQEPVLFTTTIRENITYGKGDASDEEINVALKLANAANFINKLPEGLDTMVGEHGTQLSGGQKQRIAIARAILKNPRIILLDEATSALDAESERVVQSALERVMSNRTTVVVAHRLSTIRNADIIAVVHAGKLIEQGIHEELIKKHDGAYSQLVLMQSERNHQAEEKRFAADAEVGNIHKSLGPRSISVRMSSPGRISYVDPLSLINIQEIRTSNAYEEETPRTNHGKHKRVSIKRLAYLNKPELPVLFLASIAACVHGLLFPLYGLITASAIKIFSEPPNKLRKDSTFWALMYVGIGCCSLIFVPVQNYLFGVAGGRLIQRIRSFSFQKIVHQEISWFDSPANSSGAVGSRLATDATNIRSLVGDALALVVQNIATITGGIVIAFSANWMLAFIILAVLPLLGLQGFLQMKFYKGFSADAKLMYEEASQVASDAVGSIRTVSSFGAEDRVMDTYQKKCEEPIKIAVKTGIVSGAGLGFGSFALFATTSFCFYIGSILQQHGKASFAEIFRVFYALTTLATGISQTATLFPDLNKVRDSTASIFEILDSKPKIDSSSEEGITLDTVKGDIELRHVSFTYPTRPDVHIFRDLSLTIPSGKTVALVGESGSGKSTVISLVERFYDPDSGHVYLDGIEIQKFKISWLRQQMGLVSQEPILFNETIGANIAYGRQGVAAEEEIIKAAKAANAHNFISALPQGYNTNVGERGLQLSGGQKQRIAIARAILKDPKIILLDEATSALDAESERVVQEALDKVMVGRTTIVVAHRLATIRGADVIAVVKNGVIAEKGTHDDLLNISDGLYASLVAFQMSST